MRWQEELVERYLRELQARHRTDKNDRYNLARFQAYCADQGLLFIQDVKVVHLTDYSSRLEQRGIKATTRYSWLGSVRRWLKWATRRGHLLEDPAATWHPRLPPTPFRQVPTEAQMVAMLAAPNPKSVSGRRDQVLLEFLYGTGLRVLECANVTLADVDLSCPAVTVRSGKGNRDRCLPLGPHLAERMHHYLQDIRPQLETAPVSAFFLDDKGHKMQDHTISVRVSRYSLKACETAFSVHSIRHAFATHLLLGGAPIWALKRLLGHQNLDSTLRYTHLLPLDIQDELRRTHPRYKACRGKSAR